MLTRRQALLMPLAAVAVPAVKAKSLNPTAEDILKLCLPAFDKTGRYTFHFTAYMPSELDGDVAEGLDLRYLILKPVNDADPIGYVRIIRRPTDKDGRANLRQMMRVENAFKKMALLCQERGLTQEAAKCQWHEGLTRWWLERAARLYPYAPGVAVASACSGESANC